MNTLLIVGLASSPSLDQVGAALAYGIRELHNSNVTAIWIPLIYFLVSLGSIYFSHWVSLVIAGFLVSVIVSQIILLAIDRKNVMVLENIFSKQLSHIINPVECTYCHQAGQFKVIHATILLLAFSVYTLVNKIRARFHHLSAITITFTASLSSFFTLWMSVTLGRKVRKIKICAFHLGKFGTLISGTIIILNIIEMFM
ncbi:hypothetical protein ABE354_08290 [Brevibacillus laterosporus]|uniref:hypothetical protein n=1 Tax=Brevibacillus laterosporus TaxID=1465 RepID=UPI003D2472C0